VDLGQREVHVRYSLGDNLEILKKEYPGNWYYLRCPPEAGNCAEGQLSVFSIILGSNHLFM
jgi:hypothetical protein